MVVPEWRAIRWGMDKWGRGWRVCACVWLAEDSYPHSRKQPIHCMRASILQCEIQRREPVDTKAQT
jgi:hypothetical protein